MPRHPAMRLACALISALSATGILHAQAAFGPEWKGMDAGLVTLAPGQSTEWHVRLEFFDPPQS